MYFSLKRGTLRSSLQLFPFTKLSSADKDILKSKDFYNQYIQNGSFILFPNAMQQSENYIQKRDGSFRDSTLIAPILFLVLQAVGKEIDTHYMSIRPEEISVYYAGNYKYMRPRYKQDYDDFFKELNTSVDDYQYFIKTDISNFFSCIDINLLIEQINKICNADKVTFSQTHLLFFKELIEYCGGGKFPLVENCIASSFLATVVYLDEVDKQLYHYITDKVTDFTSSKMVRYVDDLYILFNSDKTLENLQNVCNEIQNQYASMLKEIGLTLNTKKWCIKETKKINQELKKSLYDEYFNGQRCNISLFFKDKLWEFLKELNKELLYNTIDRKTYNEMIDTHFSKDDIEFIPTEVFNYFIYEDSEEIRTKAVKKEIEFITEKGISLVAFDPKRLTVMIMKTKSNKAIKSLLNQLFNRDRTGKWNAYDTTIAISYLIQRGFEHTDLLEVLSRQCKNVYDFYVYNCKQSFLRCYSHEETKQLSEIIQIDPKADFFFFMYLCEMKRKNYMAGFAYFKNFFDRVTADFMFREGDKTKNRKPNYNKYYREATIKKVYETIEGSEAVIEETFKLRNMNPLEHASAELLEDDERSDKIENNIEQVKDLIYKFIESPLF